jgi:hypothetical protein
MNGINWKKKSKWGNYQFHHSHHGHHQGVIPRFTAAVEVPTKKQLIKLVQSLVETKVKRINLKVGITAVNPKDRYSKKIGREVSHSRVEKYEFEIQSALTMNRIHQMVPPFKELHNDSFTNIELRAVAAGKQLAVWFTINKLNKVVLGNVIVYSWPDYSHDGYRVKPKPSEFDRQMEAMMREQEKENAIGQEAQT